MMGWAVEGQGLEGEQKNEDRRGSRIEEQGLEGVEGQGLRRQQKDKDGSGVVEEAPTQLKPNFRTKSCKLREQGMKKKKDS